MSELFEIVCLAYSRKSQGKCVAGKALLPEISGAWIRPVTTSEKGEIPPSQCMFSDRAYIRVLDRLQISLIRPEPKSYQTENYLVDEHFHWTRTGRMPWVELEALLDAPDTLWKNGSHAYFGLNDRVSKRVAETLQHSLWLIRPELLSITVQMEGDTLLGHRMKVRARFHYRTVAYCLSITDVRVERAFKLRGLGEYPIHEAYLCVSLGEPHTDDYCYKLVAAIITEEPL